MKNYQSKDITLIIFAAFFLIAPLFLTNQTAFAGDPNCQSGYITNPYNNNPPPRRPSEFQRKLAAAQTKSSRDQPPPNGSAANGLPNGAGFSYISSILMVFGGLWVLSVLLRQRFGRRLEKIHRRSNGFLSLVGKPSFALSAFGLLFVLAIVGSALTSPNKVGAKKRDHLNKLKMTGISNPSNKPVFKSAQEIGGDESTQIGAPVFDAAGNRYVRGTFTRNLPIGAQTLQESKFFDLFIAKYAPDGSAVWARQGIGATTEVTVPGAAIEGATALAVDGGGNIYVGGSFVKNLTLQGGANPGVTLTDDNQPGINYESFVAKYDTNGNLLWARGGDSGSPKNADNLETGQNAIDQIVLDNNGNPYLTGFVSGPRFLNTAVVNHGKTDILLAKLNPANGEVAWQKTIGGAEDENGLDLKIDGANNLYLIGTFASDEIIFPNVKKFGNVKGKSALADESTNTFIAKFDSSGSTIWAQNLDNLTTVGGSQIAVNAGGEIFMTGYYFGSATFGDTVLNENEGAGSDEASLGGYLTKLDTDGNFIWAEGFGGVGKAVALEHSAADNTDRVYVVGTFWDGGTFGLGAGNEETLASFGGEDLFAARYEADGTFNWAKPIAGTGFEGGIDIGDPSSPDGSTDNAYNPLGIAYNPARQTMFVSGDFSGVLSLDCLTLKTPNAHSRHSYLAELSADHEPTSCRIWNGLDEDDNNWDSPDNWNGGIVPGDYNSVDVPYTGNDFDNPIYNPSGIGSILSNLTVSSDRILTLSPDRDLVLTGDLWLTGGFIVTGDRLIDLTDAATTNRIPDSDGNGGYVIGKLRRDFGASLAPFVFPVGTASGYSPVDVFPQSGFGASLSVKAVQQPQAMFAGSPNRINRYWELTRAGEGFLTANLMFHYLQTDVAGDELKLRLFKVEENTPIQQAAAINTAANTAAVNDISEFSDWTLAQLAPTAAQANLHGRVTDLRKRPVAGAFVTITDNSGQQRALRTNAFGYYNVNGIQAGKTYLISVFAKKIRFIPQIISINGEKNELNFASQ